MAHFVILLIWFGIVKAMALGIFMPPPLRLYFRRLSVCLLATLRKKLRNGFAGNSDRDPGTDLYRNIGKMCLGGGMRRPTTQCF